MNGQSSRRFVKFHYTSNGPVDDSGKSDKDISYNFDDNFNRKVIINRIIVLILAIISLIGVPTFLYFLVNGKIIL